MNQNTYWYSRTTYFTYKPNTWHNCSVNIVILSYSLSISHTKHQYQYSTCMKLIIKTSVSLISYLIVSSRDDLTALEACLHREFVISCSIAIQLTLSERWVSKCWTRASEQVSHLVIIFLDIRQSSCLEIVRFYLQASPPSPPPVFAKKKREFSYILSSVNSLNK